MERETEALEEVELEETRKVNEGTLEAGQFGDDMKLAQVSSAGAKP